MKKIYIVLLVIMLTAIAGASFAAPQFLYNFSKQKVGNYPKGWRSWPFQGSKVRKIYHVKEENGQKFINAFDDQDISQQIFLNFIWPIKEKPMLSWSWRATTLPEGGNESNDQMNDSACGLYIVVGKYSGHAMKYIWSTTLAPGTIVTRKEGKLKMKVLDTGPDKKGTWVHHKVDIRKDYKELFGKDLNKNPSGIALLTDGNAVHKPAGCDYKEFAISEN
ncbi:MAG: DUF3047 domain-containing protein [Deltaproteobacteria bacterium]|nr:DUF3047 domain-containing protein [Deltaproteobacteria bacterium]